MHVEGSFRPVHDLDLGGVHRILYTGHVEVQTGPHVVGKEGTSLHVGILTGGPNEPLGENGGIHEERPMHAAVPLLGPVDEEQHYVLVHAVDAEDSPGVHGDQELIVLGGSVDAFLGSAPIPIARAKVVEVVEGGRGLQPVPEVACPLQDVTYPNSRYYRTQSCLLSVRTEGILFSTLKSL